MKTVEQVRQEFEQRGQSIASWAKDNNFPAHLVYQVLLSNKIPRRGKSHDIAVRLGLKAGEINDIKAL
ncbi:DNA-binding protein [Acinetobacter sp. ANC 4636]